MAKQTIEIECPEGMKAIFNEKTQKIEFTLIDSKERIHTIGDAFYEVFPAKSITDSIITPLSEIVNNLKLSKFIQLQVVLKALNGPDFQWNLVKGTIWYPWVHFIREDCVSKSRLNNKKVIGRFKYEQAYYVLVSGGSLYGGLTGLGSFDSYNSVGYANTANGLLSCKDKETACYAAEHFGKLIFEAVTTFKIEGIEWL